MTEPAHSQDPNAPVIDSQPHRVTVTFRNVVIASSSAAYRVTQRDHPATYYLPPEDVRIEYLAASAETTTCPWRGFSRYFRVDVGEAGADDAAWTYPEIRKDYEAIKHYIAFDAEKVDEIRVDAGGS